MDNTFEKLNGKRVGLLRAYSGFYDKKVFDYPETKNIHYIIAARLYAPIQQMIAAHKTRMVVGNGIEIAEGIYQSPFWNTPKRW